MVERGEQRGADVNIEDADYLVAGGRGLGKAEGFEQLEELAERARRRRRRHPRGGRRRLVLLRRPDRPDGQDRRAEAVPGGRHLRRDPAQGRHAVLGEHRGDQQGLERPDLRVLRPRHRRRPEQDRPEAHRGREGEEGRPRCRSLRSSSPRRSTRRGSSSDRPTDAEDERIEVGVAIVGGGQAGLACAIRLLQLLEDDPELMEALGEVPVAVLEKGKVAGAHQLSGAVMNPSAIRELFPDDDSWPHYGEVGGERVYFMPNKKRAIPLVPIPPPFRNHGNYVISVAELNRWLGEKAEEAGAYLLVRDRRREAAGRGRPRARRPHAATRAVTRRAARRATSSPAPTSPPRRPCSPRAAGATSPAPRSRASASPPRTRRCGRSASRRCGRSSSRSTRSSTRSAGRCARRPSTRSSAARGSTP